ncbi:hypothetical protein [Enterobacter roggenkampii]|uniref:hypothetical protein n=1 Tax=Enterobacter roggenkampii TaxID=1812935 RepID=UPI00403FB478
MNEMEKINSTFEISGMVEEMANVVEWATKEFFKQNTQIPEEQVKHIVENVISPKGVMKRYLFEKLENKPVQETLYFEYLLRTGQVKIADDGTVIKLVKQTPEEILKSL